MNQAFDPIYNKVRKVVDWVKASPCDHVVEYLKESEKQINGEEDVNKVRPPVEKDSINESEYHRRVTNVKTWFQSPIRIVLLQCRMLI